MLTRIPAISLLVLFATISTVSVLPITYASDHEPIIIHPIHNLEDATICDPCFDPPIVTISEGNVVTFENNDKSKHAFTAGTLEDGPMVDSEGEFIFHSGLLDSDESYTTPPLEIGEYPYFDMVHPWMNGMIIVVEGTDVEVIEEEVVVEEVVDEVVVEEVVDDNTQTVSSTNEDGGGCLIATAAFGSEMAPQVQFLRELRDNTVLQTQAGTTFMKIGRASCRERV